MRTKMFRMMVFVAMFAVLVVPTMASANETSIDYMEPAVGHYPPYVPSLENKCGGFDDIGGHSICLMPSFGVSEYEGDVVTFTHYPAPMGEAYMAVIARTRAGGMEAVRISGAFDVYFYLDLNNASPDRYLADENGDIVIHLPDRGTSVFYIGSMGPVGHTFTLTFGSLDDFEGAKFVNSIPYAWGYWTRN